MELLGKISSKLKYSRTLEVFECVSKKTVFSFIVTKRFSIRKLLFKKNNVATFLTKDYCKESIIYLTTDKTTGKNN